VGFCVVGVAAGSVTIPTRLHEWTIEPRRKHEKVVPDISSEKITKQQTLRPWSTVNNCTIQQKMILSL